MAVINYTLNSASVISYISQCAIKDLLRWTAVFHIDSWDCTSPVPRFGSLYAVSFCDSHVVALKVEVYRGKLSELIDLGTK